VATGGALRPSIGEFLSPCEGKSPTLGGTWQEAQVGTGTGTGTAGSAGAGDDVRGTLAGVYVAVVGPGAGATAEDLARATALGEALARAGAVVVTGGMGGVMRAAAAGATAAGGTAVGILPGASRHSGSAEHTVLVTTGLGEMRNALVVRAADAVVAVGGSWGTLSEVALAVRTGTPVVALGGWDLPDGGPRPAADVAEAVREVRRAVGR
jgi:hypothetical protein